MTERSKMPARIWANPPASTVRCLISFTTPSADYNVAYIRADLVEQMAEALRIIAGQQQCIDNLMSNADVARAALQAYEAAILRARQTEGR